MVLGEWAKFIGKIKIRGKLGKTYQSKIRFGITWDENEKKISVRVPAVLAVDYRRVRQHLRQDDHTELFSREHMRNYIAVARKAQEHQSPYMQIRLNKNDSEWMNKRLPFLIGG